MSQRRFGATGLRLTVGGASVTVAASTTMCECPRVARPAGNSEATSG